ncbi:Similar to SAP30BP: SAP30-binding protein (Homo sapiens) [Cotesia congregata]|uniref:Similar to SAP30BP: SAP30-binding protein (Homo sapiens) n=1 Tax=Cotesia congregata TaxID=51543 RepID=A0A8J2HT69_COTCN|nr:Similar to SAP30BP: SAP30-binding protein (Homo sapiens) [Cotesia congregata]
MSVVKNSALASISSAYTDSEDEIDEFTQYDHQETSPIHAIIPQSFQKSNSSTPEQLTMKEELVSDYKFDEDDFQLLPTSADPYPPELQARFNNYIKVAESSGLDFNSVMQSRKEFKNPSIYEKLILHCGLDECGTNFSSDVFDQFKWSKEAHYDQMDIAQQKLMSQLQKSKTQQAKVEILYRSATDLRSVKKPTAHVSYRASSIAIHNPQS